MVNGITKRVTAIGFEYHFPLAIIKTDTANDSMAIATRGQSDVVWIQFSKISDNLGANDIEGYVDALAYAGEYSIRDAGQIVTNGTGVQTSDFETAVITALQEIADTLKTIQFLLKGISE